MNFSGSLGGQLLSSGSLLVLADSAAAGSLHVDQTSVVAIVFSVLAVEGFINELEEQWGGTRDPGLQRKVRLLAAKWSLAPRSVNDFLLLVAIRNELIHLHPESIGLDDVAGGFAPRDVIRELAERGVILLSEGSAHMFVSTVRRTEVGVWANRTARRFIRLLVEALPEGGLRDREIQRWSSIGGSHPVLRTALE